MKFLRLALKNKQADAQAFNEVYENTIIRKIRQKYTLNQELAVLRQRDTKPEEFAEYNAFVEKCKAEAKAELGIE